MAPGKVLVTGASGFVASWVVKEALGRGYTVLGTAGAFDEAVKNIDAVIHTASPFHFQADDPQELIGPAVQGTTSILQSILSHGSNVKRVVITSSTAAVGSMPKPGDPQQNLDEKSWNLNAKEVVENEGREAHPGQKYRASKVLAEIAAWEFVDKHKDKIEWDLITLQPPFVFGPIIHEVPSLSSLNTSSASYLDFLKNAPPKSAADLALPSGNFVDVRDVAWAHVEAITNKKLGNKDAQAALKEGKGRITLSSGPWTWQDVVDALTDANIPLPESTSRGERGVGKKAVHPVLVDSRRAREDLGLKFRSMTDVFGDTLQDYREKGWIA